MGPLRHRGPLPPNSEVGTCAPPEGHFRLSSLMTLTPRQAAKVSTIHRGGLYSIHGAAAAAQSAVISFDLGI